MSTYQAQFDFEAGDTVELSVRRGELLRALAPPQDGWLNVEVINGDGRRGYVPLGYVTKASAAAKSTEGQPQASSAASRGGQIPVQATTAAPDRRDVAFQPAASRPHDYAGAAAAATESPAPYLQQNTRRPSAAIPSSAAAVPAPSARSRQVHVEETSPPQGGHHHHHHTDTAHNVASHVDPKHGDGGQPHSSAAGALPGTLMFSSAIPNPAAVVEGFMKNEVYFRQLMKQRQDALAKIESAMAEVVSEVAVCKDRNHQVSRKLKDLDQLIGNERRKWKARADEERLVLAQRSQTPLQSTTTTMTLTSYSSTANNNAASSATQQLQGTDHHAAVVRRL